MSTIIRVISAAISENGATFYTEDGKAVPIAAGDMRIRDMLEKVYLAIENGNIPVEVDISTYTVFSEIEKESKGMMRFFRVAKKGLEKLLGIRAERGKVNGHGMVSQPEKNEHGDVVLAPQPGTEPVTPEIVKRLEEAHQATENTSLADEDSTVVAVVGDIPIVGAEKLAGHAKAAVAQGNPKSFTRTFERLAAVAKDRKHTAQEALMFLEKMDLPFANDGSIIAYKSLQHSDTPNVFIDNYSGKLRQGLGTLVQMDVELVDDNRRVLCSNGLHVAQRGYLGGYGTGSGHVVCLIKIAPEDVISVPEYETQKMRVRAYHIVAVLTDADMNNIRAQKSFTAENMDQASLLAKVIRGDHVPVLNITTQHRNGYTQMQPVDVVQAPKVEGPEIQKAHTIDKTEMEKTTANRDMPAEFNKRMEEDQKKKEQPKDGSEAFILFNLWKTHKTQAAWDALMKERQKHKFFKGWVSLGLTQGQAEEVKAEMAQQAKAKKKNQKKNQKKEAPSKQDVRNLRKNGASSMVEKPKTVSKTVTKNAVRIAYDVWKQHHNQQAGEVLLLAKKKAKKSWEALGFNSIEIAEITKRLLKK